MCKETEAEGRDYLQISQQISSKHERGLWVTQLYPSTNWEANPPQPQGWMETPLPVHLPWDRGHPMGNSGVLPQTPTNLI